MKLKLLCMAAATVLAYGPIAHAVLPTSDRVLKYCHIRSNEAIAYNYSAYLTRKIDPWSGGVVFETAQYVAGDVAQSFSLLDMGSVSSTANEYLVVSDKSGKCLTPKQTDVGDWIVTEETCQNVPRHQWLFQEVIANNLIHFKVTNVGGQTVDDRWRLVGSNAYASDLILTHLTDNSPESLFRFVCQDLDGNSETPDP